MPVPTGPASLLDIQNEFGGSNSISLSEYYAGGLYVSNPAPTSAQQIGIVPTSGTISIGNFLGLRKSFTFNDVVASNLDRYNLLVRASAAGWNQSDPLDATITINGGVAVFSSTTATAAFLINNLPAGSTVTLINNGTIVGAGGAGGAGGAATGGGIPISFNGSNGSNGGTGMQLLYPVNIFNYGVIAGGGGGGGGGGGAVAANKSTFTSSGSGGGGGGGFGVAGAAGVASGGTGANESGNIGGSGAALAGGAGGAAPATGDPDGGAGGRGGLAGNPGYAGSSGSGTYSSAPGGNGGTEGNAILVSGAGYPIWRSGSGTSNAFGRILGHTNSWGIYGGAGANNLSLLSGLTYVRATNSLNGSWTAALGGTWYWTTQNAQSSAAVTTITAFQVYINSTGSNISAHLFGATDNTLAFLVVNGVSITPGTTMGSATTYITNSFTLTPGLNVIRISVTNTGGAAGFNLRVRDSSSNAELTSSDTWHF